MDLLKFVKELTCRDNELFLKLLLLINLNMPMVDAQHCFAL